jgi:hypothetical protein
MAKTKTTTDVTELRAIEFATVLAECGRVTRNRNAALAFADAKLAEIENYTPLACTVSVSVTPRTEAINMLLDLRNVATDGAKAVIDAALSDIPGKYNVENTWLEDIFAQLDAFS